MKNNKKAFTLVELLVVVLIIGILSAVALPQYTFAVEKARFAEAQQTVGALQKAIDIWLLENGGYPTENIYFLGKDGGNQLSIDFEGSMDCSSEENICIGKNFIYAAYCLSDRCDVSAQRIHWPDGYQANWENNGSGWQGQECSYYPEDFPIGEKICKTLKAQDENFHLCENC